MSENASLFKIRMYRSAQGERRVYRRSRSNPSYQRMPLIGHTSPQLTRVVRKRMPSQSSGVLKSTDICCQSVVPLLTVFDKAIVLHVLASLISISGGPPLLRFSVRTQNVRR